MNRLQKKCFVASAGVHLLLFSILFVGPAFLTSKPTPVADLPLLDFIPLRTTDDMVSGGGNPNANSAPPEPKVEPPSQPPPQPQPQPKPPEPEPQKKVAPEPVKEPVVKEPVKEPQVKEKVEDSFDTNTKKPKKDFKLVPTVRKSSQSAQAAKREAEENERAERAARQLASARRKALQEFGRAADVIGNGLSAGTSVELRGPGGGGVPYANFLQAVQSIYQRAWKGRVPAGATDRATTAVVAVTISRDGTVLSARIIERSGNSKVDNAVQSTIDYIRQTVPLPEEAKESQRTVTISFDVEARKGL